MSKNIWYLHHYAGSPDIGMSYRPYYLAKYLNKQGFNTSIIAASFHHLLTKQATTKCKISTEEIDDISYIWLKACQYKNAGVRRLLNIFNYTIRLLTLQEKLLNLAGKPDVIIVSSTHLFHYLTARKIARRHKAKLIFEVRDLWPLSVVELLGVSRKHPLIRLMAYIEEKAYQEADYVTSVLPNAFEYMSSLGLEEKRYRYIPNGVDTLALATTTPLPESLHHKIIQLKSQNKFIIVYTGAHGIPNALDQLISALKILQNCHDQTIFTILVGNGSEKKSLQKKSEHLDNIFFHDPIPKTAIATLLQEVDACFLGWLDKQVYHYGVSPNKVFDYMLSSKPIIQAINTKHDPVEQAGCGIIVPAEQPDKLAASMVYLSQLDKKTLKTLGENGDKYVKTHHDYKVLADEYAQLF
jgi:glycosyltransferase involved in cell wall biosynthesis